MGRPLNINRLGGDTAAAGTQLQAQAKIGASSAGNASVVQQKSQSKFRCMNGAAESATCLMVDKAVGDLDDNEMSITATAAGGTPGTPAGPGIGAPVPIPSVNDTTGSLPAGTYSYRVSALNALGETLASTAVTATTVGGSSTVTLAWPAVTGATGYKVYGRTGGSELLMDTPGNVLTWDDDGTVLTPSGALPTADTTGTPEVLGTSSTFRIKKITNRFCWDFADNRFMWTFGAASGTGHDSLVTLPSA